MTRSLQAVLDQAQDRRDAALAATLRAEDFAARARQQERQLQDYRADYQRRAPTQMTEPGHNVNMELVRCHHGFMQRLDQAVAQQTARRTQLGQTANAEREALLALELHVAAVGRLMQRRHAEASQREQRQEQRRTDEWAQGRAAKVESDRDRERESETATASFGTSR